MQLAEFTAYHSPALEADEVRYNLILGILARAPGDLRLWTLGGPGECMVQSPGRPLLLGALTQAQCRQAAEAACQFDFVGVTGCTEPAGWFVARAAELGARFGEPIPLQIQALRGPPAYPPAPGCARVVGAEDAALFADWLLAFSDEAVPEDPKPSRAAMAQTAADGRYSFWIVDGEPVAMAGIVRRTRTTAAIAGVYTPPALRGRGYGGSVTAAVAERVFAEGRTAATVYVDLRNPFSRRCYAKIGFTPACDCLTLRRVGPDATA